MNTNYQHPDYVTIKSGRHNRTETLKRPSRTTGSSTYKGLENFLYRVPIGTVNEFGEKVLMGRRIC